MFIHVSSSKAKLFDTAYKQGFLNYRVRLFLFFLSANGAGV